MTRADPSCVHPGLGRRAGGEGAQGSFTFMIVRTGGRSAGTWALACLPALSLPAGLTSPLVLALRGARRMGGKGLWHFLAAEKKHQVISCLVSHSGVEQRHCGHIYDLEAPGQGTRSAWQPPGHHSGGGGRKGPLVSAAGFLGAQLCGGLGTSSPFRREGECRGGAVGAGSAQRPVGSGGSRRTLAADRWRRLHPSVYGEKWKRLVGALHAFLQRRPAEAGRKVPQGTRFLPLTYSGRSWHKMKPLVFAGRTRRSFPAASAMPATPAAREPRVHRPAWTTSPLWGAPPDAPSGDAVWAPTLFLL